MPSFLNTLLDRAEGMAENIITLKNNFLGTVADYLIPREELRTRLQEWFINFPRPTFPRLSQWLDQGIKNGTITLPNTLSLSRLPAGIVFFISVYLQLGLPFYLSVIAWAVVSDFFDGVLARKMKQETEFGAALDAGCDKFFAAWCAVSLWHYIWLWNAIMFLALDATLATLAIIVLRAKRRGTYHGGAQVKSNWLGKLKFCCQGLGCLCVLLKFPIAGNWALLTANLLAVGSIIRHLEPKRNN